MKLTDDIVKALHRCVTEGYESVTEFARLANVSAETVKKYMRRETESIKEEPWSKLQPLLKPYMGRKQQKTSGFGSKYLELDTDQRILLDTFADLPDDVKKQKLLEMVELAKQYNREKNGTAS